jgi:hypothetical protein
MPLKMNGLTRFRKGVDAAIDRGTFRAAGYMAGLVGDLSPVDEGDLRSSARVEPDAANGGAVYAVKSGGVDGPNKFVDYAAYVEDDQPFFDPARRAINVKAEIQAELAALAKASRA